MSLIEFGIAATSMGWCLGVCFKLCYLFSCVQFDGGRVLIEVWFVFGNVRVDN